MNEWMNSLLACLLVTHDDTLLLSCDFDWCTITFMNVFISWCLSSVLYNIRRKSSVLSFNLFLKLTQKSMNATLPRRSMFLLRIRQWKRRDLSLFTSPDSPSLLLMLSSTPASFTLYSWFNEELLLKITCLKEQGLLEWPTHCYISWASMALLHNHKLTRRPMEAFMFWAFLR